jgi:hypothetical protein
MCLKNCFGSLQTTRTAKHIWREPPFKTIWKSNARCTAHTSGPGLILVTILDSRLIKFLITTVEILWSNLEFIANSRNCPVDHTRSRNCPVDHTRSRNCPVDHTRSRNCPADHTRSRNCPIEQHFLGITEAAPELWHDAKHPRAVTMRCCRQHTAPQVGLDACLRKAVHVSAFFACRFASTVTWTLVQTSC